MKEQHNRTPREIVKELDRYIIGQDAAKKAIAVALRNRYRRQKLDADMQKEVTPKNILMIGTDRGRKDRAGETLGLIGRSTLRQGRGH